MDEREYEQLASDAFSHVMDLFEDVDPDELDVEQAGDVITLTSRSGQRIVLNTQRPARQIWLAGSQRAWHFAFDRGRGGWFDDKRPDEELLATLRELVGTVAGIELK